MKLNRLPIILAILLLSFFIADTFSVETLAQTASDYIALQNKCQSSEDPGCCMSSVRKMRNEKFINSENGKCPTGYKAEMYRCKGSLTWCAPDAASDIAVNGGGIGDFNKRHQDEEKAKREQEKPRRRLNSDSDS